MARQFHMLVELHLIWCSIWRVCRKEYGDEEAVAYLNTYRSFPNHDPANGTLLMNAKGVG